MSLSHLEYANLLLETDNACPFLLEQAFVFLAGSIVEGIADFELLPKSSGT